MTTFFPVLVPLSATMYERFSWSTYSSALDIVIILFYLLPEWLYQVLLSPPTHKCFHIVDSTCIKPTCLIFAILMSRVMQLLTFNFYSSGHIMENLFIYIYAIRHHPCKLSMYILFLLYLYFFFVELSDFLLFVCRSFYI